jgi:hypothetical protein
VLGHNSMVHIVESQLALVLAALAELDRTGATVLEPTPDAAGRWADAIGRRMRGSGWTSGGCRSFYLDEHGRSTVLWPGTATGFRRATRRLHPGEYLLR